VLLEGGGYGGWEGGHGGFPPFFLFNIIIQSKRFIMVHSFLAKSVLSLLRCHWKMSFPPQTDFCENSCGISEAYE